MCFSFSLEKLVDFLVHKFFCNIHIFKLIYEDLKFTKVIFEVYGFLQNFKRFVLDV